NRNMILLEPWAYDKYNTEVPTTPEEVALVQPEVMFLGHAHFDHANDAGYYAKTTHAVVVGTAEHCYQVTTDAGPGAKFRCEIVAPAAAPPGFTHEMDDRILSGVDITAIKHVHSTQSPPDTSSPANTSQPCPP